LYVEWGEVLVVCGKQGKRSDNGFGARREGDGRKAVVGVGGEK